MSLDDSVRTTVGNLLDLLDEALSLLTSDDSEQAKEWKLGVRCFLEDLSGRRMMLKRYVRECLLAAQALNLGDDKIFEVADTLVEYFDDYCDQLPLIRQIEMLDVGEGEPSELLAKMIYTLSLQVGSQVVDTDWANAPQDTRRILLDTASQIMSTGIVPVGSVHPSPETIDSAIAKEFAEMGLSDLTPKQVVREVAPPTGVKFPPNIPMPEGFYSDSELLHHPGTDRIGHPIYECEKRGCDAETGTDQRTESRG